VVCDGAGPCVRLTHLRHHRHHDHSAGLLTESLSAGLVAMASSNVSGISAVLTSAAGITSSGRCCKASHSMIIRIACMPGRLFTYGVWMQVSWPRRRVWSHPSPLPRRVEIRHSSPTPAIICRRFDHRMGLRWCEALRACSPSPTPSPS
jgi:hypothetical protein